MITRRGYQELRHLAKKTFIRLGFYSYPSFMIIGAQKAGTTYLYSILRQHPQVIEPVYKEAHFFDYDNNYKEGLFKYKLNFDLSFRFKKNQLTFEATPDYLHHRDAPKRISHFFPHMKMIIVLRDPVARAYSAWKMHHYHFKNNLKYNWLYDPRTFEQVVEQGVNSASKDTWSLMNHVGRSLYGQQIMNYFHYFPKDHFLILFHKDLATNPQQSINRITDFVNISEFSISKVDKHNERYWENKSDSSISGIREKEKHILLEYYKGDKELLNTILKINIEW